VNPRNLFALLLVGLLMACGKKSDAGPDAPVPGAASTETAVPLNELTHAVRRYAAEKQKAPQSLDEVVAAGYIKQLPEIPAGQKLVLQPKRLEVVLERK
jgi:hypothetical protein